MEDSLVFDETIFINNPELCCRYCGENFSSREYYGKELLKVHCLHFHPFQCLKTKSTGLPEFGNLIPSASIFSRTDRVQQLLERVRETSRHSEGIEGTEFEGKPETTNKTRGTAGFSGSVTAGLEDKLWCSGFQTSPSYSGRRLFQDPADYAMSRSVQFDALKPNSSEWQVVGSSFSGASTSDQRRKRSFLETESDFGATPALYRRLDELPQISRSKGDGVGRGDWLRQLTSSTIAGTIGIDRRSLKEMKRRKIAAEQKPSPSKVQTCTHRLISCKDFPKCRPLACPYSHPKCQEKECRSPNCPFDHSKRQKPCQSCGISAPFSKLAGSEFATCGHKNLKKYPCRFYPECQKRSSPCCYLHGYCESGDACSDLNCCKEHPKDVFFCYSCTRYVIKWRKITAEEAHRTMVKNEM